MERGTVYTDIIVTDVDGTSDYCSKEVRWNGRNSFQRRDLGMRVTVEWIFKEVKMHVTVVDSKRKMRLLKGLIILVSHCCMSVRNCIHPNQIAQYLYCPPPSLEKYLKMLSEDLKGLEERCTRSQSPKV